MATSSSAVRPPAARSYKIPMICSVVDREVFMSILRTHSMVRPASSTALFRLVDVAGEDQNRESGN